jgi:PAS domain S-box-containing protein
MRASRGRGSPRAGKKRLRGPATPSSKSVEQQALRHSEARFRAFARASGDWFWETDAEGRYTWVSPEVEQAIGRPAAWYAGRSYVESLSEGADLSAWPWKSHLETLARHEPFRDFVCLRITPRGPRWLSVSGLPCFDDSGRFRGYRGAARDITGRVEIERQARATDERLRANEARLDALVNSALDAIVVADSGRRIVLFNPAAQRIFGWPAQEILGAPLECLIPERYRRAHRGHLERYAAAGSTSQRMGEAGWLTALRADGSEFPVDASIAQFAVGEERFFTIMLRDISERVRMERELRDNEAFARAVFNSLQASIAVLDAQGNICAVNEAWDRFARANGADEATRLPIGRDYLAACAAGAPANDPGSAAEARSGILRVLEGVQTRFAMEYACHAPNEKRWYAMNVLPLAGGTGGALVAHADISARRRAEDELRESEERFQRLFRSSPVAHALLRSEEDRYLEVNEAWLRVFGYARDEVIGRTSLEIGVWESEEDARSFARRFAAAGRIRDERARRRRRDGEVFEAIVSAERLELAGVHYRLTSVMDISRETRAVEEARRLNEELEQRVAERTAELEAAARELESFSYSVSHDLRAPARAIAGFSRIVLDDYGAGLPQEGRDMLLRIARAGETMGAMVDGLLEMSRVARGAIERRPVDLASLAAEAWRDLAALEPERKVVLHMDPELRAQGDPVLLRNLLQNLLGNARKYTRQRPDPAIWLGRAPSGEFFVRDNGVGFDMAHARRLFGAFQRLHTDREFEGHGIGLALAKKIVERHGGTIRAEASTGEGATFFFRLE